MTLLSAHHDRVSWLVNDSLLSAHHERVSWLVKDSTQYSTHQGRVSRHPEG